MSTILKDVVYYKESGGGVTFSGGEPLLQPDAVLGLAAACRPVGIATCLDTCGYAAEDVFDRVARSVDAMLYDIKTINPEIHRKYVGTDNELILRNFRAACGLSKDLRVRHVIVPGITDTAEDMQGLVDFLHACEFAGEIDLLPYHGYGQTKYAHLGLQYDLQDLKAPEAARMLEIAGFFEDRGCRVAME